jgi:hypothetical protein
MTMRNPHFGVDGDQDEYLFDPDDEVEVDGEPRGSLGELIPSLRAALNDSLPGLGISPNKTPEENGRAFAEATGLASAVAKMFAGFGVTAIEWADDDGSVSMTLDTATGTLTEGER